MFAGLLQWGGAAMFVAYFWSDSVSSVFVPIIGVVLFIVGRFVRGVSRVRSGASSSLLHMAARRGDISVMETLLSEGYSLEGRSDNNTTPLHWTAFKGHVAATRFLLDKGADANARDQFGMTPLRHAEMEGHSDVVALLAATGGSA